MADRLEGLLEQGIRELGLGLPASAQPKLIHYLHLLTKWNKAFNLSGVTAIQEMLPLHLLDSLAVLPHLPVQQNDETTAPKAILDIGSGAGLPGIPLAIACPERRFVLLDSNGKKTRFLFQAKLALGLENIEVVNARVDDYIGTREANEFPFVTCRAFASLQDIVTMIAKPLREGSELLAMKGVYPQAEIDALPAGIEATRVVELKVPGVDSQRHLVFVSHKKTDKETNKETNKETDKEA